MNLFEEYHYRSLQQQTRRHFLKQCASGLGGIALGAMMGCQPLASQKKEAAKQAAENLAA
jgi:hypothetical protein